MNFNFNTAANDDRIATISLNAMRGQALNRLSGIHQKLDSKGVSAAFTRSAKADPIGDMGFLGCLIVDMLLCSPIFSAVSAHIPAVEAFNHAAFSAGLEGLSVMSEEINGSRSFRKQGGLYPEGRRKCALEAARTSRKFNLVSGSQNNRFSFDVEADLACMYEVLDMLDRLENEGVRMMRVDLKQPIYDTLKQTSKRMFGKEAIRSYARPMLKAV